MLRDATKPSAFVAAGRVLWPAVIGTLACLVAQSALPSAEFVYRRAGQTSPPNSRAAREARATLALILYKQQQNLFDHRYLDEAELDHLRNEAGVSAQEAVALTARLKRAVEVAPVDVTLSEQLGRVLQGTRDDAQALAASVAEPFGSLDSLSPQSLESLQQKLRGETLAVRDVVKLNIGALETVDQVARGIEREERLKREKELSALNRARLAWQTARSPEDAAAARRDYDRQMGVVRTSTQEFEMLQKSRLRTQSAIRFFEQVEPAFEQFDAATTYLSTAHRMTQDLSGMDRVDQTLEALQTLSSVADWGIQKMGRLNAEQLARDKAYLRDTILMPRFGTGTDSTYVNGVLQRLPYQEADAQVLEQAWAFTNRAQQTLTTLRVRIRQARAIVNQFDEWESQYESLKRRYGDVQTADTRNMVMAFQVMSNSLLAVPDLLKENFGLADQHLACQALRYVGHTVGMLPTLVNRFSDHKLQRDQFVSLPLGWQLPTDPNAPALKARHMFLHEIGLAAYSDLAGLDQQAVFVPTRDGNSGFVKLTRDAFEDVLRAMSVFTTLTGRNPTQDEFLRLCESRGEGPNTSRSHTFFFALPDPSDLAYFQMQERALGVADLLGSSPNGVWPMPRYADVYVGRIVQIATDWNDSTPTSGTGFNVQELLKIEPRLLRTPAPADPDQQLRFRTLSRRYDDLVELMCKAYGQECPVGLAESKILQAILLQPVGQSPLEQKLRTRAAQGLPEGKYEVAVTATHPALRKLRIVVSSSAPRRNAPRQIAAQVDVHFPGQEARQPVALSPPAGSDGRNVLYGEVDVPIAALARGGEVSCTATVRFDEVVKTAEDRLRLPTLIRPADPVVSPDLESGSYVSYQFRTAVYHHPKFRIGSGSECEVVLVVQNAEIGERPLKGPFRYTHSAESMTDICVDVRVDDPKQWPPGTYTCRYEFRLPDYAVRTNPVDFEVLDLAQGREETPAAAEPDDLTRTPADATAVPDPTGPLRAAWIRASELAGRLDALSRDVRTSVTAVEEAMRTIDERSGLLETQADALKARIDELAARLAEIPRLVAQIGDAARKAIEANHAARHAADAACEAADRADAAGSREQWQEAIDAAKTCAAEARRHQVVAAEHTTATLQSAGRLRELDAALSAVSAEIGELQGQAADLQTAFAQAQETLAVAIEHAVQVRDIANELLSVRQLADGLLAAGKAVLVPFGQDPSAREYGQQLETLHQQIVEMSKPAESLSVESQSLITRVIPIFNSTARTLQPVLQKVAALTLPANDHRDELLTALAQADVAEVWLVRGMVEIGRAATCSNRAASVPTPRKTPPPGPTDRSPTPRITDGITDAGPVVPRPPGRVPSITDGITDAGPSVPRPPRRVPNIADGITDAGRVPNREPRGTTPVLPPFTRPPARTPSPDTGAPPVQPAIGQPLYAVYGIHQCSLPKIPQQIAARSLPEIVQWIDALRPEAVAPSPEPASYLVFKVDGDVLAEYQRHQQAMTAGTAERPYQLFVPNARYHVTMTLAGAGARLQTPLFLSFRQLVSGELPAQYRQAQIHLWSPVGAIENPLLLADTRSLGGGWSFNKTFGNNRITYAAGPIEYDLDDRWLPQTLLQAISHAKTVMKAGAAMGSGIGSGFF